LCISTTGYEHFSEPHGAARFGAAGGMATLRPETIAQLEAEIADCDEVRRLELMAEIDR
jgi:hypothetical protein